MDQRITLITLGVADLEASRGFYERLGWKRSVKNAEGVAFYQTGGVALALYPRTSLAEDLGVEPAQSGFRAVTIAQNVRSRAAVDRALEEAVKAGARLVKPGADVFWGGYVGYFADPDGHVWEVAWNPDFPLDNEGRMTLPD
jgi:predicted lactoylglutathione lyase